MTHSSLPSGNAKALGFDPDRLAGIAPAMQQFIDDRKVPHLVTLIARKGQIVHLDARGVMDFESRKPVNTHTLFRLYSNSKPIAGVATLILYENGVLTPDDPVSKFVPELADLRVQGPGMLTSEPARRNITIRDCLTNTTSLNTPATMPMSFQEQYRDALQTLGWIDREDGTSGKISTSERMAAIARIPLADHPGRRFVYHVGYPILGAVLEAAAGQNMGQFFKEQIFNPLGMTDSDFYLQDGWLDRFPTCYIPRNVDGNMQLVVQEDPATSEKNGPPVNFGVGGDAGGVLSTATDYARFGQMLLNGGELDGNRILGRKTVDYMRGNHTGDMLIPMTGRGFHFGLGAAVYHGENARPLLRSRGTFGWGGAAGTTAFFDPVEEIVGVCFTQVVQHGSIPENNYQETFQRLVYQSLV